MMQSGKGDCAEKHLGGGAAKIFWGRGGKIVRGGMTKQFGGWSGKTFLVGGVAKYYEGRVPNSLGWVR